MPTNNQIHIFELRREFLIIVIADMAHHNNLVHSLLRQLINRLLNRCQVSIKLHRIAKDRNLRRRVGNNSHHPNLLLLNLKNRVRLHHLRQLRLLRHINIRSQKRIIHPLGIIHQRRNPTVELMVPKGLSLVAHRIQNHAVGQAIIHIKKQRALKNVARIQQQNVLFLSAHPLNQRRMPSIATIRLPLNRRRLNMSVQVIGVQNRDR